MKTLAVLLLLLTAATAKELPTAPSYRIVDWSFVAIHGVHAAALSWDLLETSRGVSHGCEEASTTLGPHPSTGRMVGVGLAELGGVIALDVGMKALARSKGLPRWFAIAGGSIGASIGTAKHLRGGYLWTQTGCL